MAKTILTHNGKVFKAESARLEHHIAAAVMNGTNEEAMNFLNLTTQELDPVPILNLFPLGEVRRVYLVSAQYLSALIHRTGMKVSAPNDIVMFSKSGLEKFMSENGATTRQCKQTSCFCIEAEGTDPYSIRWESGARMNFISPRMLLALSCLMVCGKTVPAESPASKIVHALKRSSYGKTAKRTLAAMNRAAKKAVPVEVSEPVSTPAPSVKPCEAVERPVPEANTKPTFNGNSLQEGFGGLMEKFIHSMAKEFASAFIGEVQKMNLIRPEPETASVPKHSGHTQAIVS